MTDHSTTRAMPSPTFAAGIQLATGVRRGEGFAVAQVLAFHVPPSAAAETVDSIRDGMRAIAAGLRLGPPDADPPYIGRRIDMPRGTPYLDYGCPDYRLTLPVGPEWRAVAEGGGPIRLLFLFEPLSPVGANRSVIDAHVTSCFCSGAMAWGTTYL